MRAAPLALVVALVAGSHLAWAQPSQRTGVSPAVLLLRTGRSSRDRIRAAETLGATRPPGAREALERALRDRAVPVRLAAVEALRQLGDTAALPALRAVAQDPNAGVRDDVARVVRALESMPSARGTAPTPAAAAPTPPPPVQWGRVRHLLTVGNLSNQARSHATDLQTMRATIAATIGSSRSVAVHPGSLPADVAARVARGQISRFSLEGGLRAIRPGSDPNTVSIRAEVSYALIEEPGHNIVGSLDGAATVSEPVLRSPNAPDPVPRLIQRAIEAATQGALQSLERELDGRGRRRRRG
jgi:hypothetical protein